MIDPKAIRARMDGDPTFCILCGEFHKTHPPVNHECACRQKCLEPFVAKLIETLLAYVDDLEKRFASVMDSEFSVHPEVTIKECRKEFES